MPNTIRTVGPGAKKREVRTKEGLVLSPPSDWDLLPPGDAALTRRVKAGGPHWIVKQKKGRRTFSLGVWAPRTRISAIARDLEVERADPAYKKKLEAGRKRRAVAQEVYAEDFEMAVLSYLGFASAHMELARRMAQAIADHAVPVGSGTVARTKRIPIERRAEAATIAWMRHQTTAYDHMTIPRERGKRREVRRMLAQESKRLLNSYRRGGVEREECPLRTALSSLK